MSLQEIQNNFIGLMRSLKTENDRNAFLRWIYTNWNLDCIPENSSSAPKEIMNKIAEEIRSMVPFDAILPSEKIKLPVCGPNSDCESKTTLHVDEFLYNDDLIDELVEKGLISRHFCGDCFSKNIKLLTLISHSMSISRIQYVFTYLLPPLKNKTVLDVGSRLGPILYGAYVYTSSPKIIGVELNADFCEIQTKIIKKYNFSDRIEVICNNILNETEVLSLADVVILNNVFEFFMDEDNSVSSWLLLAQNIKPDCILVTVPHLSETFHHVKVPFDWRNWVEELHPFQPENCLLDEEEIENHQSCVKHYRVKERIR